LAGARLTAEASLQGRHGGIISLVRWTVRAEPVQTTEHSVPYDAFVGRVAEFASLRSWVDEARAGRGSLALISGEPGIGKTRLAQETAGYAAGAGMRTLWGACWPGEGAPSFWPWIQILRSYAREADAAALIARSAPAEDLAHLVPELIPAPPDRAEQALDPDQQQFRMFDSLATVFRKAGEAQPLLFVVDDLHWADPSSVAFLDFLAREIRDIRALLIGTHREQRMGPDHALVRLPHDVHRLRLRGLSLPDTARLILAATGHDPGPPVVEATHRRTGGNPFYIREVAHLLEASGGEIPSTVREAVSAGLKTLSGPILQTLSASSVAGAEFEAAVIAHAIGEQPDVVRAQLDDAVAEGVVVEKRRLVGRYAFSHSLVRETLSDQLSPASRADLHGRLGEAIEAVAGANLDGRLGELSHHFLNGRPEDGAKAVEYSRRAGERALKQHLYGDGLEYLARALEVVEDESQRLMLTLSLGDAAVRAGEWPRATDAFMAAAELARRLERPEELARAALGLGAGLGGFEVRLFDQRQIDLLEEAIAALPVADSSLLAWIMARLSVALSYAGSEERRVDLSKEAVAMARRVGDPPALAYALSTYCDAIATPEHLDERLEASAEMVRLAREAGDRELELLAHRFRVESLFQAGDIPGLDAEIEAYARLSEVLRQPLSQWYVPLFRGARALMEGRFKDSERLAAQALEMGERAHSMNARMMADFTQLTEAYRQEGRFEEMEVQWRRFVEAYPEMASVADWIAFALATVGQGDQAKARADIERLAASGALTMLGGGGMWIVMTAFMAEVAAAVRSVPAAEILYEALGPFGPQLVVCGVGGATYGSVWRELALLADVLGRHDEAVGHFERALEAHRAAGALPYLAHTQREFAATLLTRGEPGDRERAGQLLDTAIETYRRLGMHRWLEQAEALNEPAPAGSEFRRDADVWAVGFAGRTVRLKDSKGLRDIALLLVRQGIEVHCSELIASAEGAGLGPVPSWREVAEGGLSTAGPAGDGVLDDRARAAYKARLADLQEDLDDAEQSNDPERAARARAELDFLAGELAAAYGLGGQARKFGDPSERARKAVAERIRAAIARVKRVHPELSRHLENSIRTGIFCSYRPETHVDWKL
jgi:tetratricopeptide (TPR) repeat protein